MITYKEMDAACLPQYDRIPMRVEVSSYYRLEKDDRGLGGIRLVETETTPYQKDFCTGADETMLRWQREWDLSNWGFFMAFEGEKPIGAATIVTRTAGIHMLAGRDDLAVLWDIRVHDAYKRQGVGQTIFDMATNWCRAQGMRQLKIECQNNNVPACRFYHRQGAVLCAIDEYAYYNEPEFRHETQLIWMLDL